MPPGAGGRTLLDAIAQAEGTAGRGDYNASLGYGKYLPGGKEMELTGKTLNEIYQLGLHMRKQPGNPNSSALGRYQIVGSTMMDAAKALGMDPATTKFDAATQDKMAEWIARKQGLGAWEGFKTNPAALSTARGALGSGGSGASRDVGHGGHGHSHGSVGEANHMRGQYGAPGSNLTTIAASSGKKFKVHSAAAESFQGFIKDLEASGYKIRDFDSHSYAHRAIRGGSKLSQHAYGNAIDINATSNALGSTKTDMPPNVSEMAAKWGLKWGGDFKGRKDPMHFEWTGRQPWKAEDLAKKATPEGLSSKVPMPAGAGAGAGAEGGGVMGSGQQVMGPPQVNIHIAGGQHNPEQLANMVQRRISEAWNWRTHDVEHDLA